MISEGLSRGILYRLLLLPLTFAAIVYLYEHNSNLFILVSGIGIYQFIDIYRFHLKAHHELHQFVESLRYRDFSRHFDEKHASFELRPLRKGFNEINNAFKLISKEKETQYQYLQKILELVNTGILSYEAESGEIIWMNESLKQMLQVPYLKTIHSMNSRDENVYAEIISLKPGNGKIVLVNKDKNAFKALLSCTAFQTDGKKYILLAFQNVNEALDETESKAWQKLLSVMTHEIMNSVAPISSLAGTLKRNLERPAAELLEDGSITDIKLGIETIKNRSEGLLKFTEIYRSLNKITTLNLRKVYIRELFGNLHQLMQPTLNQKNIDTEIILKDPELSFNADINLLEQVLINLFVNAIDALKDTINPKIILSAGINNSRTVIRIADNGPGMSSEVMDKIFVPFFTTKKNGSGIGLSLSKQIMLLHHGNIQVQSAEGSGTIFLLLF